MATVEQLLHPELAPPLDEDLLRRYHVDQNSLMLIESSQAYWLYRNYQHPTAPGRKDGPLLARPLCHRLRQAEPRQGGGEPDQHLPPAAGWANFRTLLLELSRDPAMIFWLDNKDNHKDAPNENYGRELLELFSMGIGNYTEDDVKACARAFTGWTIANADYMSIRASRDSIWPHGRLDWQFVYRPEDHDDTAKTFLGHTGAF